MSHLTVMSGTAARAVCGSLQTMHVRLLPMVASGFVLVACATIPVPTTVETPGMPNPETALRKSMQHVDAEMAELGISAAASLRSTDPVVPDDLQRLVSFTWSGPLDKGVAKLALSIGYTFYTTGASDQQPVPVSIEIATVPVYRVFQMLGEQAGTAATVQVNPLHHQVEVIHHA